MNSEAQLDRLRRNAKVVSAIAWGCVGLMSFYGMPIVYRYLTHHDVPHQTAWMLPLAVDLALGVALVATPLLAENGEKAGWVGVLRWIAGLATWALNTAESWFATGGPDIGGVIGHTWGPLVMFFAIEAAAHFHRKIADVIHAKEAAHRQEAEEATRLRAEAEDATRKAAEERAGREAEERKRKAAEERAESEAAARRGAEERAEAEAEGRAEERAESEAEIARLIRHAEEVQASARSARAQAAEQSEQAARIAGQLDEARGAAERAVAAKMAADQHAEALTESREALADELANARQVIARLQQRLEAEGRKSRPVSAPAGRKKQAVVSPSSSASLPPSVPGVLPPVEGVSSALVARVISAYLAAPTATQKEIAAAAQTTDRTVRTVLNQIPADHPVLAIEAGVQ